MKLWNREEVQPHICLSHVVTEIGAIMMRASAAVDSNKLSCAFRPLIQIPWFCKTLGSAELGLTTWTFCRDLGRHVCLKMPPRLVANRRLKRSTRLVTHLFSCGFAPAPLSSVVAPFSSGFTPSSSCSSGHLRARKALERCIPSVAGCNCGCGLTPFSITAIQTHLPDVFRR